MSLSDAINELGSSVVNFVDKRIEKGLLKPTAEINSILAQARQAASDAEYAKQQAIEIVDPSGDAYYSEISNNTSKLNILVDTIVPTTITTKQYYNGASIIGHNSTEYATSGDVDVSKYRGKYISIYTCWSGYQDSGAFIGKSIYGHNYTQKIDFSEYLEARTPGYITIKVPDSADSLRYTIFTSAVQASTHVLAPKSDLVDIEIEDISTKAHINSSYRSMYINTNDTIIRDTYYNPSFKISFFDIKPLSIIRLIGNNPKTDKIRYRVYDKFFRVLSSIQMDTSDIVDINIPINGAYLMLTLHIGINFGKVYNIQGALAEQPPTYASSYSYFAQSVLTNPLIEIKSDPGLLGCFPNVGCIGDSLASGEAVGIRQDGTTAYVDNYKYSWGQYLARRTGNKYYNFSSGGQTAKGWLSSNLATSCFSQDKKCEAYIVALGVNEGWQHHELGQESDIDVNNYNNNGDTYYGNLAKIIQKLKEFQPKGKIFILTAPADINEDDGYNDAVRYIASIFSNVYLVDLYKYALTYFTTGIIKDCLRGGHGNAISYSYFASILSTYIDWIMKHKFNEFREIEFIGTDYHYY